MNMRRMASRISHLSRRLNIGMAVIFCLYILIIPVFILEKSSWKELEALKAKHRELSTLSLEYKSLKVRIDTIEQRDTVKDVKGVVLAVDSILSSLGVKGKMKAVRASGSREIKGAMTEEDAEVQMEKLNMNELVNLFYKIENAPMILSVKGVKIKKSFENPELLDITMTVALFTKK